MPILQSGIAKPSSGYDIEQSLRFEDGDSAYLARTPSSSGNRQVFTVSAWVKLGSAAADDKSIALMAEYTDDNNRGYITFGSYCRVFSRNSGSDIANYSTDAKFRDPSAWYHVVFSIDVTQSTAANRVKIYVNGIQQDITISSNWPEDTDTRYNASGREYHIGKLGGGAGIEYADGYVAEYNFIDGNALDASSFGETNSDTNQWVPIEYDGSYGTNGFYLPFSSTELANSFTDSSSSSHTITANGDVTNTRAQKKIGSSSIKFDGTGDYLSLADSADWNIFGSGNWTTETWVKLDNHSQAEHLFGQYEDGSNKWEISHNGAGSNNGLEFGLKSGGSWVISSSYASSGSGEITDTDWHHVALVKNSNTYTLYLDGTALDNTVTDTDTDDISGPLSIGQNGANGSYLTGYMDEIRISDTARYTSSFTPSTTAFTADSNTKLLIHSDFNGGIGADSSGNTNDFTPTNLVATDQVLDSPTNNFATMNPLAKSMTSNVWTWAEGNLKVSGSASTTGNNLATIGVSSGKWYWEVLYPSPSGTPMKWQAGVYLVTSTGSNDKACYVRPGATTPNITIDSGFPSSDSSQSGSLATFSGGDILGIALDLDGSSLQFYHNGSTYGTAISLNSTDVEFTAGIGDYSTTGNADPVFYLNFGQDSSFAGSKTAQGNTDGNGIGDFYYTPPSGYLALCTANLTDPSIADPTSHFNTVLYTGNGSNPRSITGVGFQPDFHWRKKRNAARSHNLHDVVRGAANFLYSDATAAEVSTDGNGTLSSFDSDGFTFNSEAGDENTNNSGDTYVAWNWKAGGTASSNTDGTITSSVSANTDAGFSIVGYTGTGANATVGHGLSQRPDMFIVKNRSAAGRGFVIWAESFSGSQAIEFDTSGVVTSTTSWNSSLPTSTVINLGTRVGTNESGETFIAYCFHSVDGYSKVGSYTGNGSSDGTFIYTGFRPAWFMCKRTNSTNQWTMADSIRSPYNVADDILYANLSDADSTSQGIYFDFVSNGIKLRSGTAGNVNTSGSSYIYLAFAESPFKTSNAR